jgi:hypothetical protein
MIYMMKPNSYIYLKLTTTLKDLYNFDSYVDPPIAGKKCLNVLQ